MLQDWLDAKVSLAFGLQESDDRLLVLHENPPACRHHNLAELHAGCAAESALLAVRRLSFWCHRRLGRFAARVGARPADGLPGRQAERFGMGPAVVLGQDLAEASGAVRDGAATDLAAGNRKLGNGGNWTCSLLL
jgi:hypothetical protein